MGKLASTTTKMSAVFVLALTLTACGSEENAKDINDWVIDVSKKEKYAELTFVNMLDEMATFYGKTKQMNRDVFDNRQQINSVSAGEGESHKFKWGAGNQKKEEIRLGVADTNTLSYRGFVDIELEDTLEYWTVAWKDNEIIQLSAFKRTPVVPTTHYNLRFFALKDLSISVEEGAHRAVTLTKGLTSDTLALDHCTNTVKVAGSYIDFCAEAEIGNSYLIIIGQDGQLYVGKE